MVGLVSGGDESTCRDEVERLTPWRSDNNLFLNTSETKELIVDFRRNRSDFISGDCVETSRVLAQPQ